MKKIKRNKLKKNSREWPSDFLKNKVQFNPKHKLTKGQYYKKVGMADLEINQRNIKSYSLEKYKGGGATFKNGDTLLARITPSLENGKTALVDILEENETAFGSTEFIVLSGLKNETINKFVYYLARSPKLREIAISSMTGTSGRQRVQEKSLKEARFYFPFLEEQREISKFLSLLDDKIELNDKTNKTLEEIGKTLFKQWFIDFEFPWNFKENKFDLNGKPYKSNGGKFKNNVPENWKKKKLSAFFPIKTGKKDANIATESGQYPFFTCAQEALFTDEYSFDTSAILLAGNGDFNIKWHSGKFEAYQRTYVLEPYQKEYLSFLYFLMKEFLNNITAGHRGSVIKYITKSMIGDFKIIVPNDKLLKEMSISFSQINYLIENLNKEVKRISKIRNLLLPKLMNGEIKL
jgi:type I restriction enzyme S subunit